MIFKKILLKNIRSYKNQEIIFPEGSILLSGDIGAGKTSVLLGIEFALFGLQPGQKGSSLLRNGEKEGSVTLELDIGGKSVLIERTLKRGKTINQDYCAITIDNIKKELSVTELKEKILDLLSYPKEFSKKQNLLYKFTVYTPQEEMKQIIIEDPEVRINTLRHIFGVDKYKRILENINIIIPKIREEKRVKEGLIESLETDKADLITKKDELKLKYSNLELLEKELYIKSEAKKLAQEEKDSILVKLEEKKKLQQEVEKTKIIIGNKKDNLFQNLKTIEKINSQIKEISNIKFQESEIGVLEDKILLLKKDREKINEDNIKVTSEISSLNIRNQELEILKKRLNQIDTCPTCLQDIDPVYKSNVLNKLESDINENKKRLEKLNLNKSEIIKKLKDIEDLIFKTEREIQNLKILKIKISDLEEKKIRIEELVKINETIEKDINLLESHIKTLNSSIFELNKFEKIFLEKQRELENALKEERVVEIKIAELNKEIEFLSKNIEELEKKIKRAEEIKNKIVYISKIEDWLSNSFFHLISNIEKNVMIKLKADFSKLFSQWFSILVSDTFNVWLDYNFTPRIEYQDYEIDYQ
ncbi:MAG: SMC family ATPase, partial [Candidatus Pacearchaeota archaeon]